MGCSDVSKNKLTRMAGVPESITRKAMDIKSEIEQLFLDVEHWNTINPDEKPIDPDPDGKLLALLGTVNKILGVETKCDCCGRGGESTTGSEATVRFRSRVLKAVRATIEGETGGQ